MSSIGPQLPAHLVRSTEEEEEEEEEEAYAPELPPDYVKKSVTKPIHGRGDDDDDDDDDEIGPKPIRRQAEGEGIDDDPVCAFMERENRRKKAQEEEEAGTRTQKLQREEWMLVPPSSSSLLGSIDQPGKVKARQFSRNSGSGKKNVDNSLWTETPAEKQARIKDEVEGKRKRATDVDIDVEDRELELRNSKRSKETEELVENYNREMRGKSLLDMHQSKGKREKDNNKDDEPIVIWDRERDMSVGGRLMDERQRSRMIQDARGLSSRFSKGKGKSGYL